MNRLWLFCMVILQPLNDPLVHGSKFIGQSGIAGMFPAVRWSHDLLRHVLAASGSIQGLWRTKTGPSLLDDFCGQSSNCTEITYLLGHRWWAGHENKIALIYLLNILNLVRRNFLCIQFFLPPNLFVFVNLSAFFRIN